MRRQRTLEDTPAVRGMINKIRHLVRVVDDKAESVRAAGAASPMRLNELKDKPGSRKIRVRIGRGIGSGMGKQGGRGGKGQTARSGVASAASKAARCRCIGACPSAASTSATARTSTRSTLGAPAGGGGRELLDAGKPVDVGVAGRRPACIRRALDGVRLLGDGELKAKLALTVNHATATAKAAVEKAGGSITLIEKKVLAADEAKRKKTAAKKAKTRQAKGRRASEE